jgi:hypothetical protein
LPCFVALCFRPRFFLVFFVLREPPCDRDFIVLDRDFDRFPPRLRFFFGVTVHTHKYTQKTLCILLFFTVPSVFFVCT